MKRIVITWELGSGLGHIVEILSLGSRLEQAGYQITYVLSEIPQQEHWFASSRAKIIQAPRVPPRPARPGPVINYSEILLRNGFDDFNSLSGIVEQWRMIFMQEKPDLIIADHSPNALIAARSLDIPRVLLGNSFLSPPAMSPFPSLQPWKTISEEKLQEMDQAALMTVNRVLENIGMSPWQRLCELFEGVSESFLATFAEMDPYPKRHGDCYWGLMVDEMTGEEPQWPTVKDKNIYVYIRADYVHFKQFLTQLSVLDCNILVHAGQVNDNIKQHFNSEKLVFTEGKINIESVMQQCDVVVCHGNHNSVITSLLAGKPLLTLPYYLEHTLTALLVEKYGAGLVARTEDVNRHPGRLLSRLLSEDSYTRKARGFATKYQSIVPSVMLDKAAVRCSEILA
jgi:UDP:flavonoid glycosyltransferase YjiC (YdhE family)